MCVCLYVCTGWIRYSERILGSLVTPHICTARSPQQIMGCLVKDYFSKQQVSIYFYFHRSKSKVSSVKVALLVLEEAGVNR